ncbi:MAG: adenylyltransferase [Spirochaetae bacterium HGW-Spirochaetae-5]|nr:MAG: adenylyltransferase [Spirochaetae bacterium HGW-Spirochaetae-5]
MLTENELIRYKRQLEVSGWDKSTQEKLKSASVFVAGAGGLGSPVLYYLAAAGVGHIKICDRDKIDLSNLNRQILYNTVDTDNWKAETASAKVSQLNDEIKITYFNSEAGWPLLDEIKECGIIVDCLDNFESRHILNRISLQTGIPMIHAGVSEYYGQMTFLQPGETPCLACFIPEDIKKETKGIVGAMAGIVGSMQAIEVIKFLTDTGDILKNRLLHIDGKLMNITTLTIKRNPDCKVCSK